MRTRRFIYAAMAATAMVLFGASIATAAPAKATRAFAASTHSSIASNFNGTSTCSGATCSTNYIWFNAVMKLTAHPAGDFDVCFFNQAISLVKGGTTAGCDTFAAATP